MVSCACARQVVASGATVTWPWSRVPGACGQSEARFSACHRASALAIGELVAQAFADLPGTVEAGELAVREEARGLLLPTAIWARWRR